MEAYLRNHKETVHGENLLAKKIHFLSEQEAHLRTHKETTRNMKTCFDGKNI